MAPQPSWALAAFYFSFLIYEYTRAVGLLERVISSSQGLYLNTRQHKHRKTHIHIIKHPCPQGGIRTRNHGLRAIEDCSCLRPLGYRDRLASERAKTVHALDRSATATDMDRLSV
jgi:hypothetical protein